MNPKYQKGITLIEAIIYIAIIALVLVGFTSYVLSASLNREKIYVISEVNANSVNLLDSIKSRIYQADSIDFNNSDLNGNPGLLQLNMLDVTKNPTIITIDENDNSLIIKEGADPFYKVTNDKVEVSDLVFTDLTKVGTKDTIQVEFNVQYKNNFNDIIYNYDQDSKITLKINR